MPDDYTRNHSGGRGTGWGPKAAQIRLDSYERTKRYLIPKPSFIPYVDDAKMPLSVATL